MVKRKQYFAAMDKGKKGSVSFNEWLDFAYKHIVAKVVGLLLESD